MAYSRLNEPVHWDINVSSRQKFTQASRDFIVELVSEEARKAISSHSFVLHDAIESTHYCRLLVEAPRPVLAELLRTMRDNLPHRITVAQLGSP